MQQHKEMHTSSMTEAFNFVLQNPNTALDEAAMCGLLCSSKAVRATAQQAGPCTSICVKRKSVSDKQVASRATASAKWLPPHAHLVGEIELDVEQLAPPDYDSDDEVDEQVLRALDWRHGTAVDDDTRHVLDSTLVSSLQQITAGDRSGGIASTAAPSSKQMQQKEQQQQQRLPFALRSFSSSVRHGAELLCALPVASLTSLSCLWTPHNKPDFSPEDAIREIDAAGALTRLTNLRHLSVEGRDLGDAYLLDAVEALTQLTCLHACGLACNMEEDLQALPDSLKRLQLQHFVIFRDDSDDEDGDGTNAAAAAADEGTQHLGLCHLTRLTQLSLQLDELSDHLRIVERLPPQLLELTASAVSDDNDGSSAEPCAVLPLLGGLTGLQQLQRLTLRNCRESKAGLLALNGLTSLTEINLRYDQVLADVQTSSAWAQLKQLRSLHVRSARMEQNREYDGGRGVKRVMEGIEAAGSLRKLHLDFRDRSLGCSMRPKLFGYLTGLRQLQELRVKALHRPQASENGPDGIDNMHVHLELYGADSERVRRAMKSDAADIMQLTALTGLTRLEVTSWTAGVAAAGALATGLPQLQRLKLYDCSIESTAALPAIGRLVHLQHLDLRRNLLRCDDCLQLLTQLRALTCIELVDIYGAAPSRKQLAKFWAAVRG